ncbi:MAG: acyltransferase family protein [Promethearchaeota archaeon]
MAEKIENIANEESDGGSGKTKAFFRIQKQRINWIDQARGVVMFILVFTSLLPEFIRNGSLWPSFKWFTDFFFDHPPHSYDYNEIHATPYMNLYDVGVPAFFFIIGLLMAVTFNKRIEKYGVKAALSNALLRWGLLFVVGILFLIIPAVINGDDDYFGKVEEIAPGVSWFVVKWDVVIALGFVGLCSIPFLFLPTKIRLIIAYVMMSFYQLMIFIPQTYWRAYAQQSVHGGILGGIFVLIPITLIASTIGDHFILNETSSEQEKQKSLIILGLINLVIGVGLWLIPYGYPNKRQSTMSWATISLAVCIFAALLLVKIDYKDEDYENLHPLNKARIVLFKSYGMNPLLIYAIVEIYLVLVEVLVGNDPIVGILNFVIMFPLITIISYLLYRKNKAISTTKVAAGIIILVVALTVILLPFL